VAGKQHSWKTPIKEKTCLTIEVNVFNNSSGGTAAEEINYHEQ